MINPHCSSRCILCMLEWTSQILDMNEDKKAEEKFTIKMPSLMNVSPKAIIGTGWMGWKSPRARGLLTTHSVLICCLELRVLIKKMGPVSYADMQCFKRNWQTKFNFILNQ